MLKKYKYITELI